jgi:AcrR family transcriptional regulator
MGQSEQTSVGRQPVYAPGRITADAVFAAAEALFALHGFERTTMRMVAAEAGVTVGSVYQFFDDKQALLDQITTQCLDLVDEVFVGARTILAATPAPKPAVRVKPGPLVTNTVAAIVNGLVTAAGTRPMFRTLLGGGATEGPLHEASETVRARVERGITKLLNSSSHHPSPARVRRTSLICSYSIRGLIGTVVGVDGRIDRTLRDELETLLTLYVFHSKAPT